MPKVFNLKNDEEITSVIERLWETGAEEVFFVAAQGSVLMKNIIGLKLLKREAERLGKEITIICKDEVGREMAKRAGIAAKAVLPKNADEVDEPTENTLKDLPQKRFEDLLREQISVKRTSHSPGRPVSMSDIRIKTQVRDHEIPVQEEKKRDKDEELEPVKEHTESLEFAKTQFSAGPDVVLSAQGEEEILDPSEFLSTPSEKPSLESFFERPPVRERPPFNPFKSLGQVFSGWKIKKPAKTERAYKKSSGAPKKLLVGFSIAAVVIFFGVLYMILPQAEVQIVAKTEGASQDIQILADKSLSKIDTNQNRIPAQLIRVDKRQSGEFEATGERQLNEKAKGTITVYNEYSSSPQSLVERTRFVSESGKTFRTAKTITVPGAKISEGKIAASSIDVEVVADEPGSDYNIDAGRFTIPGFQGTPKYNSFYGISKSAMAGGASGLAKVVSQEDFDKAKNQLWQSLQPALDQEFKSQVPEGMKMIEGAFKEEIGSAESEPAIGSQADKFTLTVKGTAAAVLIDEKNILLLIQKKLLDKMKDQSDFEVKSDGIVYQNVQADLFRGVLSFKAKVNEKLVWKIDAEAIKKEIAGKAQAQVQEVLSLHDELDEVSVAFWPFWVKTVPQNPDKIKMTVSEGE